MTPPFRTRLLCVLGSHSFGDPEKQEGLVFDLSCTDCPKKLKLSIRGEFVPVSPRWSLWERIDFLLGR